MSGPAADSRGILQSRRNGAVRPRKRWLKKKSVKCCDLFFSRHADSFGPVFRDIHLHTNTVEGDLKVLTSMKTPFSQRKCLVTPCKPQDLLERKQYVSKQEIATKKCKRYVLIEKRRCCTSLSTVICPA